MKFAAAFIAASALLCSHLIAAEEATEIGEVKGMPLVFNGPVTFRQEHLVKGQALTHSRSESTSYAVPDPSNPYIKVKGTGDVASTTAPSTGVVGVAFSATNNEESSSSSSSSSGWTAPLAVGGCAVAAVGIAGFVVMKKRQQRQEQEANDARTPATQSPHDELVQYNTDMETPV